MNPARFRWGVLFILVGGLLLLNNTDVLDWWVWGDIVSLWPLILIAIGVEKICTKTRFQFIAYLAPVILAVVVVWVAFEGVGTDGGRLIHRSGNYRYTLDMEPGVKEIKAVFDLDDTDVRLRDTRADLFRARSSGWRATPDVEYTKNNGVAEIDVSPRVGRLPDWIRIEGWRGSQEWELYVSDEVPIVLKCTGDQSDMNLECRELRLKDLTVDSRKGEIRMQIGSLLDQVAVKLEGDEADFRLTVPRRSGVRVSGGGESMAHLFERVGLTRSGNYFITAGYDTLTPKINLDLSPEISRFSLEYE